MHLTPEEVKGVTDRRLAASRADDSIKLNEPTTLHCQYFGKIVFEPKQLTEEELADIKRKYERQDLRNLVLRNLHVLDDAALREIAEKYLPKKDDAEQPVSA